MIATFVTAGSRARRRRACAHKVGALQEKCRERTCCFDFRPKVHPQLIDNYYTPGAKLEGRCLYPFLHARVSFSGKVYFCPFIRVEVGDLTQSSLEESLERGALRRRCGDGCVENGIFPVCRRCCKVELSPVPLPSLRGRRAAAARRAIPLTVVR